MIITSARDLDSLKFFDQVKMKQGVVPYLEKGPPVGEPRGDSECGGEGEYLRPADQMQ